VDDDPADAMTSELFERSLRTAFDYAPIGMAVLTPTGVVITCNAALGELLGWDPASLTGSTLFEVTYPDDLAIDGQVVSVTATVGLSTSNAARTAAVDATRLLRQADERMYEAKRQRLG
jgi:PAS domain-containing protein